MLCFFGVMRVRIPSKHDGPSGHMRKNWVPEWEQSVADGMNRPQDKHPCLAWPIRRSSCRNGFAVVAQLAEQRPRNAQVTGPNPVDGSFSTKTDLFFLLCLAGFREVCNRTGVEDSGTAAVAQLAEQPPCKRQVVGS